MRLSEVTYDNSPPIDGYGPGFFRIGGQVHNGDILLLPNSVTQWNGYEDTDLLLSNMAQIDVLFIGTGAEIMQIPTGLRTLLQDAGTGVEQMATPTACRTYNVLLGEGRRIGAALLSV